MTREISIQIESLELHGVASFDADHFSASLNHELSGLLATGNSHSQSVKVGAVFLQAPLGVDSATIGGYVARAIYSQMRQGE